jgi:succinate dehydrogenase/fumarate reductase-like Fe-S protein
MLRGYRGFLRELARTGSGSALWLQLRSGAWHVLRRMVRRTDGDPIERFLASYGADGFRLPDPGRARLQHAAEACLACGLCSLECARAGGAPGLDPRDAVVAAARLEIDWIRLGLAFDGGARVGVAPPEPGATTCGACRACEVVCPVAIPIAAVQDALARLTSPGAAVATSARIR